MSTQNDDRYKDWLNPLNKLSLIAALKERRNTVVLDLMRGRTEFSIDYDKRPGQAYVKPMDGQIVPSGWFDVKRHSSKEWFNSG